MKKYIIPLLTTFVMAFSYVPYEILADDTTTDETKSQVVFSSDGKTLLTYPAESDTDTYNVPEGIEIIASSAFNNAVNLKTILLPGVML